MGGPNINKRHIGAAFEKAAAEYLKLKGYKILERNFRSRIAEIDIIAYKDGTIVFFEVKYRSGSGYGDALEAVNIKKQKKICMAARFFCMCRGCSDSVPCRFDVIAIYSDKIIRHIEAAFDYIIER